MTLLVVEPAEYQRRQLLVFRPGSFGAATFAQARQMASQHDDISLLVTELIDTDGQRAGELINYVRGRAAAYLPVIAVTNCGYEEAMALVTEFNIDAVFGKGYPSLDQHRRNVLAAIQKLESTPTAYQTQRIISYASPRQSDAAGTYQRQATAEGQDRKRSRPMGWGKVL